MIKMWLDDVRPTPDDTWTWVTDIEAAKRLLLTGKVVKASLDHDLGADGEVLRQTGYDLVKWMAENDIWPLEKPTVHSANPVGRGAMLATIERYFPRG